MVNKLDEFISESINFLKSNEEKHERARIQIDSFIRENILNKLGLDKIILQDRIKKPESLREKIIRKGYYQKFEGNSDKFMNELPDVIGIRIVCFLNDGEHYIDNQLKRLFRDKSDDHNYTNLISQDGDSLYIHFNNRPDIQLNGNAIYKYTCKWISSNGDSVNIEIQVKSLVHMFWGELEHMMIYKNYNYTVGHSFYREIMVSIYSFLKNIDNQLSVIQKHLEIGDTEKQVNELKEIYAKILHKSLHEVFEEVLEVKADLRILFDSFIKIKTYKQDSLQSLMLEMPPFLNNAMTFAITKADFDFTGKNINENKLTGENQLIKEYCYSIDKAIKSYDIYWQMFFLMYSHFYHLSHDYTEVLKEISKEIEALMRRTYSDSIEIDNEANREEYSMAVSRSFVDTFKELPSINFINESEKLLKLACEFIENQNEQINILEETDDNSKVYTCLTLALNMMFEFKLEKIVNFEKIDKLIEIINDETLLWKLDSIDMEALLQLPNYPAEIIKTIDIIDILLPKEEI